MNLPAAVTTQQSSHWFQDAVIYQLHVRSFRDGNADGIGDFAGLTATLDYLQSLGITAVWLLPFYPSPLRDDGYDISDYFGIHPSYGTLRDFKTFLREAHGRDIRVITELVLNHTSDQHEWFRRARVSPPGSSHRNYYVWSDTSDKYRDARVIFNDFETSNWAWDQTARGYYWHRFYSHQPDLNFDNPAVRRAMLRVIDFWMDLGVDGMRLDAVPYLFEAEGTDCENLPQTYEFLREVRAHVDASYRGRMLLAEANQWPEDAAAYFGKGDMCHMAFHFPLMPRMFMALQMEDWFPIVDILEQTPPIPPNCQWATFLRNHDELTLEMVSEEERDYMYRYYARDLAHRINLGIRRRLAPLMHGDRRKIEIMNFLLCSLPGTPIIYYGDEIGMGDNPYLGDRNGVRTPMQWSADRNAGFSCANPQRLNLPVIIDPPYHYETVNVENEEQNVSSLLWWTRRLISLRRRHTAFSRGRIDFLRSDNANVLTFLRTDGDETVLVVVNLSRFAQVVSLDISSYAGFTPCDLFGSTRLPIVKEGPYLLTMGMHDYFWLALRKLAEDQDTEVDYRPPELAAPRSWHELFTGRYEDRLRDELLPRYLQQRVSAGCRPLPIRRAEILDKVHIKDGKVFDALLLVVNVHYTSDETDTILLPVTVSSAEAARTVTENNASLSLAHLTGGRGGVLYDCVNHIELHRRLLDLLRSKRVLHGEHGELCGTAEHELRLSSPLARGERLAWLARNRRNNSFAYGKECYFKLYRRLDDGVNPEVELLAALRRQSRPSHAPRYLGSLAYRRAGGPTFTLGMYCEFVENTGSALTIAQDSVVKFLESTLARRPEPPGLSPGDIWMAGGKLTGAENFDGVFHGAAERLGAVTAELHRALASITADPSLSPEPSTPLYQRSLYQSLQSRAKQTFTHLRRLSAKPGSPPSAIVDKIKGMEHAIHARFLPLVNSQIGFRKMRIHGDLSLDQFLHRVDEFVIKDFEGNPDAPLSERRLKRPAVRDIAGVVHSLHTAVFAALYRQMSVVEHDMAALEPWARAWFTQMSSCFLGGYFRVMEDCPVIPAARSDFALLLRSFLLDRALKDIDSELLSPGEHDIFIPAKAVETYLT